MSVNQVANLEQKRAAAAAERQRIRDEAHAEGIETGVKIGERHKAWAFGLAGFVAGAVAMSLFVMLVIERTTFNTSAVAATAIARAAGDPNLPAGGIGNIADEYERNTALARRDACREGVRDTRTGLCPREPRSVSELAQ